MAAEHPDANGGWRLRLAPVTELTGGPGFYVVIALFLLSIGLLMAIAISAVVREKESNELTLYVRQ